MEVALHNEQLILYYRTHDLFIEVIEVPLSPVR